MAVNNLVRKLIVCSLLAVFTLAVFSSLAHAQEDEGDYSNYSNYDDYDDYDDYLDYLDYTDYNYPVPTPTPAPGGSLDCGITDKCDDGREIHLWCVPSCGDGAQSCVTDGECGQSNCLVVGCPSGGVCPGGGIGTGICVLPGAGCWNSCSCTPHCDECRSDGTQTCYKDDCSSSQQSCTPPTPPPTCDFNRSFNECCGTGLSRNVDEFTWSDGSGVCFQDIGECTQCDAGCGRLQGSCNACGNGRINPGETCETCPQDVGACPIRRPPPPPPPPPPGGGSLNLSVNPTSGGPSSGFTANLGGVCGGGCESNIGLDDSTASCGNQRLTSGCPNWNWQWDCSAPATSQTVTLQGRSNCGTRSATYSVIPPIPSTPTGLTASCPSPGTSASLDWNDTAGATHYALRVDNPTNGWNGLCNGSQNPGDICEDVATSSKSFSSTAGLTYAWWVHACNSAGCSSERIGPIFTCTPAKTFAPWIQTTGDVHSNEGINTPGGP